MPFQYSDYRGSPAAGSIAELMLRRGEIAAQQANAVASAQARAAEVGGQASAGAAQNIGQGISGAIQQATDPRRKMEALQAQAVQGQVSDQSAVRAGQSQMDSMMAGDQLPAGATGPRQESYLNADGLFDVPKLNQALAASGKGHLAPELLKGAEAINASITQHQQDEAKLGASSTLMLGDMAKGALDLSKVGMPITAAMDFVIQPALATKRTTPQQYAQIRQQIGSLPPEQQAAALTTFMDAAAKIDKGETLGKDSVRLDRYGRTIATNQSPTPHKTRAELAADAANPNSPTQKQSATALDLMNPPKEPPKAPAVGTFEDYVVRKFGQNPTPAQIEQGRKSFGDAGRITVVAPGQKSAPGDWDKTGDDFLGSIPAQWRTTVKKIANYEEDPTKVASMRGGMRETLTQWVNQVNPAYDAGLFTNRAPTRKAFTTGTQGQQINALNTAIGHLDQLIPIAEQLNNSSFLPGNAAANALSSMFGSDKVTNFETLKDALAGEVASVLSKGSATVSGIAAEKEKIKAASSPQQLAGYVKTLIPVMGSKLAALDYQYHQAMGDSDSFSALSPQAKQTLTKFGFDPAAHSGAETIAKAAPAGVSVTSPGGKTYTFKSQADADAAVAKAKAAGLWK